MDYENMDIEQLEKELDENLRYRESLALQMLITKDAIEVIINILKSRAK